MSGKDGFLKNVFSPTGKKWSTRCNDYEKYVNDLRSLDLKSYQKHVAYLAPTSTDVD